MHPSNFLWQKFTWIGPLIHLSSAFYFQPGYGTETSSSQLANRFMTFVNITFEIPNQGIQTHAAMPRQFMCLWNFCIEPQ